MASDLEFSCLNDSFRTCIMIMVAFITVNKKKFSTLDCRSKLSIPRGFEVSVLH